MAAISETEFKRDLKALNLKNIYLLYGEEKYLVKFYTNKIKTACLGDKFSDFDFNLFSFKNNKLELDLIQDSIMFPPILSPKKFILIEDLQFENISMEEVDKFIELFKLVHEKLILLISQVNNNASVKKSTSSKKLFKAINQHGDSVEFKRKSAGEISQQLVRWARSYGSILSNENAQKIIDYSSKDYHILSNELKKLCAFTGNGEITEDIIDNVMTKNLTANIFEISRFIFQKKYDKVYKGLEQLLINKEDPIMIVAALASIFIDIYRVKVLETHKKNIYNLLEYFDYKNKEFKLKKAEEYFKMFSLAQIKFIIKILKETDIKLKSVSLNPKIILENMILQIILQMSKVRKK